MKIGIITFHDTTNYGSYLQTYGLYKKIVDLGYQCEIIDYQCRNLIEREMPQKFTFSLKGILTFIKITRKKNNKYKGLYSFLCNNMNMSPKYYRETISIADFRYDKVFSGSDIVWGLDITGGDTAYFLDFVSDKKKKFAYASSIGNPIEETEKNKVAKLLSEYNRISVRENEAADWVEELTGVHPDVVCDPTMLLSAEEWKCLVSNKYHGQKYALVYFDNSKGDCVKTAMEYAHNHGLKLLVVGCSIKPANGFEWVQPNSIEDFLSLIYHASFIATTSYHGLLFSIYFNNNFVYFNNVHKSRINTLVTKLGVSSRDGEKCNIQKLPTLDFNVVNQAVEDFRRDSTEILKQMLSK